MASLPEHPHAKLARWKFGALRGGGNGVVASARYRGALSIEQLEDLLQARVMVDHDGLHGPGDKTVYATCSQESLNAALADYEFDPFFGLKEKAEAVLAGKTSFPARDVQLILARLALQLVETDEPDERDEPDEKVPPETAQRPVESPDDDPGDPASSS